LAQDQEPEGSSGDAFDRRELLMQAQGEREANLRTLANWLEFTVEKSGDRFVLTRTANVAQPVREEDLALAQAEELLATWKLRGFHGG
jgi:hypothetical protein